MIGNNVGLYIIDKDKKFIINYVLKINTYI